MAQLLDLLDTPTPALPPVSRATVFDNEGHLVEQKRFWRSATSACVSHPHAVVGGSSGTSVLKMACSFKHGVLDGEQLLYGTSGAVFTSRPHAGGLLHGSLRQFRDDGTLVYVTLCRECLHLVTLSSATARNGVEESGTGLACAGQTTGSHSCGWTNSAAEAVWLRSSGQGAWLEQRLSSTVGCTAKKLSMHRRHRCHLRSHRSVNHPRNQYR
jgi:hypothetical protein